MSDPLHAPHDPCCSCNLQPIARDWVTAAVVVFHIALQPWSVKGGWLACIPALVILAIPTVLALGLLGILP